MNRYQKTRKVAVLGITTNIFLLVIKLSAGFLTHSQAMIADGFNSAGDVFASVLTYVGNKIASKPEDKNHPYGHGKAEYIFSMIISFSLLIVAYKIFISSIDSIFKGVSFLFSWWLIVIGILTIILKLGLFIYTRRIGKKEYNLLVLANSEDHRNDVFVTSSALLGILLERLGIAWADGVAGIGISLWITFTAARIFLGSYHVLMDTNIDEELKADVLKAIKDIGGVAHIDEITSKPVGVGFIIIVKVSVSGEITVREGHRIAARIKENVMGCNYIDDVVVHVNPV